jgi:hypothetical protein
MFYGTRRFIALLTRGYHWSLSWARRIYPIPPHPISVRFVYYFSPTYFYVVLVVFFFWRSHKHVRLCGQVVTDCRRYQIFWVVDLERGPLSLVSTVEELLGRNTSGSGLESQEYGRRHPSRWPRGTFYPQTLALTSPTRGGCSVEIVRSQTQAT